eukprot:958432-Pleurochrysis_carterae.AAC.1
MLASCQFAPVVRDSVERIAAYDVEQRQSRGYLQVKFLRATTYCKQLLGANFSPPRRRRAQHLSHSKHAYLRFTDEPVVCGTESIKGMPLNPISPTTYFVFDLNYRVDIPLHDLGFWGVLYEQLDFRARRTMRPTLCEATAVAAAGPHRPLYALTT